MRGCSLVRNMKPRIRPQPGVSSFYVWIKKGWKRRISRKYSLYFVHNLSGMTPKTELAFGPKGSNGYGPFIEFAACPSFRKSDGAKLELPTYKSNFRQCPLLPPLRFPNSRATKRLAGVCFWFQRLPAHRPPTCCEHVAEKVDIRLEVAILISTNTGKKKKDEGRARKRCKNLVIPARSRLNS